MSVVQTTMSGSDKVKIVADSEPEEGLTSSSSSGRPVSWLHLCVIYSLLGIYALWAATSYELIRSSLLDELEESQRRNLVAGELGVQAINGRRLVGLETDTKASAAARQRRSIDVQGSAVIVPRQRDDVEETQPLSRRTRETRTGRRGTSGRRRRNRDHRRRTQTETDETTRRRSGRRRPNSGITSHSLLIDTKKPKKFNHC